jgi:hypothetical protein
MRWRNPNKKNRAFWAMWDVKAMPAADRQFLDELPDPEVTPMTEGPSARFAALTARYSIQRPSVLCPLIFAGACTECNWCSEWDRYHPAASA